MPDVYQHCIKLHFRILVRPTLPAEEMFANLRRLYRTVGIDAALLSSAVIATAEAEELMDVDVYCDMFGPQPDSVLEEEQLRLFQYRDNISSKECVIYFVNSTYPETHGCASHPEGAPGAIVTADAPEWTLSHEVGHVLGLAHVDDTARLMTSYGAESIHLSIPEITKEEVREMLNSDLVHHCKQNDDQIDEFRSLTHLLRREDSTPPEIAEMVGAESISHLQHVIRTANSRIVGKALLVASIIDRIDEGKLLATAALSGSARVRHSTARAAANLKEEVAEQLLQVLMADPDAGVRKAALKAIATIKLTNFVPQVRRLTRTKNPAVKKQAQSTLATLLLE